MSNFHQTILTFSVPATCTVFGTRVQQTEQCFPAHPFDVDYKCVIVDEASLWNFEPLYDYQPERHLQKPFGWKAPANFVISYLVSSLLVSVSFDNENDSFYTVADLIPQAMF